MFLMFRVFWGVEQICWDGVVGLACEGGVAYEGLYFFIGNIRNIRNISTISMTCKNVFWNIMEQLKDIKDLAILLHL